jgi:hypothetical protein
VFISIGVLAGLGILSDVYAEYALGLLDDRNALALAAAWVSAWSWFPALSLMMVFTPLLFPDGRLHGPRWRLLAYIAAATTAVISLSAAFAERLVGRGYLVRNPLGIPGLVSIERAPIGDVLFMLLLVLIGAAISALIRRFRRSRGEERQQLKWFVYAGAVMALTFVADDFLSAAAGSLVFAFGISLVPLAIGVAILKYRLYEIDRIINRTLVYGVVTAILIAGYGLTVLLAQSVLPLPDDSPIVVAASTLAMVALIGTLRQRVQDQVDRRFYRRRYDAVQIVEHFSASVREDVDLDVLSDHLLGVVQRTMQPAVFRCGCATPAKP